ncbi:MAG TPA: DUF4149 domain-containing protein, partial [Anaerolineales bacterium]|nr:DUF4149 domain-containing protein [Anaerolineales bacterium]
LVWLGRSRRALVSRVVLGSVLLLLFSLGSHAATETRPLVPLLGDWVHLMAASVWVGGLVYFLAGMIAAGAWPTDRRTVLASELIPRFSLVAASSVAAILLTGTYSSVLRLGGWSLLWSTTYGRVLLCKILLALVMVGLGAVNLLWVTPRMRRGAASGGDAALLRTFRRTVALEATLGALVLLAAGLLTSLAPARESAPASAFLAALRADDLRIELRIDPARPGVNTFAVSVAAAGQPVTGAKEVELQFTPRQGAVPPLQATLTEAGGGRYETQGAYLSLPDEWQVRVSVRREGRFDAIADTTVDMRPGALARELPWTRVSGALLFAVALLAGATLWIAAGRHRSLDALALVTAVTLLLAGGSVLSRPLPTRYLVNPVPPNDASIASGRALYTKDCVSCHGPAGKGDGPIGLTLNPRPADLTLHTIPGVHPDGQLFAWISDGYPGSVMPAWRTSLSDTLRWDLVNYLRTFASPPSP